MYSKKNPHLIDIIQTILWIAITIGFYIVAKFTPLAIDDFNYVFFNSPVELQHFAPWPGVLGVYTEYFSGVGRFIPHLLVELFTELTGKSIFNFFNTAAFIFLPWIIARIVCPDKKNISNVALLTIAIIWFFMPGIFQACIWMAGTCNFLFVACIITVFYYKLTSESSAPPKFWNPPLWFILGFITGWSNEGFSIGLCVGSIIFFITHRKLLTIKKICLTGGMVTGTVFLCLTPFNLFRFISGQENIQSFHEAIMAVGQSLIAMKNLRISFILIIFIGLIYFFKLLSIEILIKELNRNIILIIAWIVSFLFIVLTHHESVYSRFPIEIFATIILMSLFVRTLSDNIKKTGSIISGILVTISFILIIPKVYANYGANESMRRQIINGDSLIVVNHINGNALTSRYFSPALKNLYQGPLPVSEHIINFYGGKPGAVIISKNIYEMLRQGKDYHEGILLTDPDIHSSWYKITGHKDPKKITLSIKPVAISELNPIQKLLYPFINRYKMTKFETNEFNIVTIHGERWIVIRHYPMLQGRITGIKIQ